MAPTKHGKKMRLLAYINAVLLLCVLTSMTYNYGSPFDRTLARNSLIATVGDDSDFQWHPDNPPNEFKLEETTPPDEFLALLSKASSLPLTEERNRDSWLTTLKIARHLSSGPGIGNGILSNVTETYQTILNESRGYCADYTQVFNGLAISLSIPVREWGISFDGFGGDGHAINEVYVSAFEKWILVDSFYSLFVTDVRDGIPLSVLEFHELLADKEAHRYIRVHPINKDRFTFKSQQHVIDYFAQGVDQFYLWFGNNVFSYDRHPVVGVFAPLHRALEQLVAIGVGVHPTIRILPTPTNSAIISKLRWTRRLVIAHIVVATTLSIVLIVQLFEIRRRKRKKSARREQTS